MPSRLAPNLPFGDTIRAIPGYVLHPAQLITRYERANLRADLVAGITVAVILLPQAIAFALIAELPPQMGLYAAVVGALVGGLWGSSNQIHTGPTNAISLLVFSTLAGLVQPGTIDFVFAASLLALMTGVFQLLMGLARLGVLVNFVSHSVIVGFASGAGILIAVKQIAPLLALRFSSHNVLETILGIISNIGTLHPATAGLGLATMLLIVVLRRINARLPAALISMVVTAAIVYLFDLANLGVDVIGELDKGFPPLTDFGQFSPALVGRLSTGALAVGAIGLVETTAISRSIATQTGQRTDSNQEFVGQGLANIFSGLFTGYPVAGSFSRSAVNFKAGARTPMAAIFSGIFVLVAIFSLGSLAAYLPKAALAGVLIVTAYGMIDRAEIRRIWQGTTGDAAIMVVTLLGTLFLEIEAAVLLGILLSFAVYIMRTSAPRVQALVPDQKFRHFVYRPEQPQCPQLAIIEIMGDLYFGAVNHVEETILRQRDLNREQRFLLIRMNKVNQCDFSGIHMLESVVRTYRDKGGDVYITRVNYPVQQVMAATGFDIHLGTDHFLDEDEVITRFFYHVLDPVVCIYECEHRVFRECQNLPKQLYESYVPVESVTLPAQGFPQIEAAELWAALHDEDAPPLQILDVREPREYRRNHIEQARSLPILRLLQSQLDLPPDTRIILVCRSGRRSHRAATVLREAGFSNVAMLAGGMLAWEGAGLLTAVEWQAGETKSMPGL